MPRITPVSWQILECIFLHDGWVFARQGGTSHRVYEKPGVARPVIIPTYSEILPDIITSNMRTAGMGRETYFRYLALCK